MAHVYLVLVIGVSMKHPVNNINPHSRFSREPYKVFSSWKLLIPVNIGMVIFCLIWLGLIYLHGLEDCKQQLMNLIDGLPYEPYIWLGVVSYGILSLSVVWSLLVMVGQVRKYIKYKYQHSR